MNDEINYKNNPLHGVSLKKMLTELTEHYGFDILFAYLNINCFRNNPSVASSVKFLKKTDWAREKVEAFYLYSFKNLPKASHQQYQLSPRDRLIPDNQSVGEPALLSLEDAERLRDKRQMRAAEYDSGSGRKESHSNNRHSSRRADNHADKDNRKSSTAPERTASTPNNPWGLPRT
ncbi:MAG: VF530 family DNA-binding protein [Granulosicoccus sp.]